MKEIAVIILFNVLLYLKTINNFLIVDDLSWYKRIQEEGFRKFSFKGFLPALLHRLYGGATFARKVTCKPCSGSGEVNKIQAEGLSECKICKGKGTIYSANVKLDHAFSILIHTTICLLIYKAFGANSVSLCAALLYACNPINNQTVLWLNGRRYAMNILIVLSMLCLPEWGRLLYFLTPGFQVSAIFSPVLFLGESPLYILPIALVIGLGYKKIRSKVKNRLKSIKDPDRNNFKSSRLIIVVKEYGFFFFNMILNTRTLMIYPNLYWWGQNKEGNKDAYAINMEFLKGINAILITILGLFVFKGPMFFMWAYMAISTLQWCALIPVTQDLADRYAGQGAVFMMFFISYASSVLLGHYWVYPMLALGVWYIKTMLESMRMYKNINEYWNYHFYHNPNTPSPRKFKVQFLLNTGDISGAWQTCKEGLRTSPKDFKLNQLAAICSRTVGDMKGADMFITAAENNIYIGQEDHYKKWIKEFRESLAPPKDLLNQQPPRDIRRKKNKKKKK